MTELQKRTAQAIVNVFETGAPLGHYGAVSVIAGDAGHLTYGRSQASLASGSLFSLTRSYCEAPGACFASRLACYLERLRERDFSLDEDAALRDHLRQAASDPVMRAVQDEFFDRAFFLPAVRAAAASKLTTPLAHAVVYDSFIQGGWATVRRMVFAARGRVCAACPERDWIPAYIAARRDWLASRAGVLPATVYRTDAFRDLIAAGKWELQLPLTVCGVMIDRATLEGCRTLRLESPRLSGDDVRALQESLVRQGYPVDQDGVFGGDTEAAVKAFQSAHGLPADGVVGPRTRAALE